MSPHGFYSGEIIYKIVSLLRARLEIIVEVKGLGCLDSEQVFTRDRCLNRRLPLFLPFERVRQPEGPAQRLRRLDSVRL